MFWLRQRTNNYGVAYWTPLEDTMTHSRLLARTRPTRREIIKSAALGSAAAIAAPYVKGVYAAGSLSLGGMLGAVAVAIKHEIVLAIVGGLFVLEEVSVIVQVLSFKLTGKRVFKMAPIHHHYEELGWTEPQIVIRFWIVAVVLALAGLATLKLR